MLAVEPAERLKFLYAVFCDIGVSYCFYKPFIRFYTYLFPCRRIDFNIRSALRVIGNIKGDGPVKEKCAALVFI